LDGIVIYIYDHILMYGINHMKKNYLIQFSLNELISRNNNCKNIFYLIFTILAFVMSFIFISLMNLYKNMQYFNFFTLIFL